jgi:hypothetical protein
MELWDFKKKAVVDQIGNPLYLLVLFEVEAGGDRDFCEL